MNLSLILSATGIFLNIVGIYFLFRFALSPYLEAMNEGQIYFSNPPEVERKTKTYKQYLTFKKLSKVGLYMCMGGMILQFVSLFI